MPRRDSWCLRTLSEVVVWGWQQQRGGRGRLGFRSAVFTVSSLCFLGGGSAPSIGTQSRVVRRCCATLSSTKQHRQHAWLWLGVLSCPGHSRPLFRDIAVVSACCDRHPFVVFCYSCPAFSFLPCSSLASDSASVLIVCTTVPGLAIIGGSPGYHTAAFAVWSAGPPGRFSFCWSAVLCGTMAAWYSIRKIFRGFFGPAS